MNERLIYSKKVIDILNEIPKIPMIFKRKKVYKDLNLFDFKKCGKNFAKEDIDYAEKHYDQDISPKITKKNNTYTSIIKNHKVSVTIKDNTLVDYKCDCNHACEHIYSLLLYIKYKENFYKLFDEVKKCLNLYEELLKISMDYCKTLTGNERYYSNFGSILKKYRVYYEDITKKDTYTEDEEYQQYISLINKIKEMYSDFVALIQNRYAGESISSGKVERKPKPKKDKYDEYLDNFGLFDYEKEEVKKGNQDECDFEEEDLEDNDYYSEDV